jgi:glycosyltransferase involved in cell wall biosynthesis
MNEELFVSIIINNYNYARYLGAAIDSALGQSYHPLEVIVVDDGSTDDSRARIAAYGERVIAVLKPNGGQASAFNTGFARSRGAIVLYLDADDVLLPETAARVAECFRARPALAKVQFRLAVIDAEGRPTGVIKPPRHLPLLSGDLRAQVVRCFDDITWQSTSGNAFAAWALRRILPAPEAPYRICADYYLSNLPPLLGPVESLDEVGGHYRIHGANNHRATHMDLDRSREIVRRICRMHELIQQRAAELGIAGGPANPADVDGVRFLAHRLASLTFEPQRHLIAGDRAGRLVLRGVRAACRRDDLPWKLRLTYVLWFAGMALAPRPLAWWMAEKFLFPETRGKLDRLFAGRRRLRAAH